MGYQLARWALTTKITAPNPGRENRARLALITACWKAHDRDQPPWYARDTEHLQLILATGRRSTINEAQADLETSGCIQVARAGTTGRNITGP
jgi:hypothetical protein